MSETTEFWAGEFGDQYLKRNRVNWRARIPFWDRLVAKYGFRSVYEVGANAGWNLSAIKHAIHGYNVACHGCEINNRAWWQAKRAGFSLDRGTITENGELIQKAINSKFKFVMYDNEFDLVYTAGVLIHIGSDELKATMEAVVTASCDYVLAIEYEADTETEIEYRGHKGKLWKRPYGRMYEEMGLTLVETGKVGKEDGFDDCTYWMLRK